MLGGQYVLAAVLINRLLLFPTVIGVTGILAYAVFTLITEHDVLAFRHAYDNGQWNDQHNTLNVFSGPLAYYHHMLDDPPYRDYGGVVTFSYLAALAAVVLLLAVAWRSLSWPHRVLSIGTALIPLLSGSMFAYYRYSMVPLLPVMIVACRWLARRPTWRDATLLCLAGLAFVGVFAFAAGYWVS